MVDLGAAMEGFTATAGVTSFYLSLWIRSVLCALFLLWAGWNVYGHVQCVQDKSHDLHDLPFCILRILLLCAAIVLLIFID
jgi:hypothetical protein